tara:strand:- start:331 stop:1491 length:1161 start_codon:yes stop_codon:yes gene_type:complete
MLKDHKKYSGDYFIGLANSLAEDVAKFSDKINYDRKIPDTLLKDMTGLGFFKLLMPSKLTGFEIDFVKYLEIINIVSRVDASVAWCLNQNNVLATLSAFMPEELALEIWKNPDTVLSNGPPIGASAEVSENGYILNGRWDFSSGFPHSTWLVALTPVIEPSRDSHKEEEMRNMFLRKCDVEIIDTWDVNGLRGTGSFSFRAENLFVDQDKTFVEGNPPIQPGPIYLIPKTLMFSSGFATVALGVARASLDYAILLANKKTPSRQDILRNQQSVQREIGKMEAIFRSSKSYLDNSVSVLWDSALSTNHIPEIYKVDLRLASTDAIRRSIEVVDRSYSLIGSNAIFNSNPIQRKFEDIHSISQQVQGRMEHYDSVGRFFLGMDHKGLF